MWTSSRAIRLSPDRHLLFVAPRRQAGEFAALLDAYGETGVVVHRHEYEDTMPAAGDLAAGCGQMDAVLLAGPARYAPNTVLPGPFLLAPDGRRVPAGWLPLKGSGPTRRFVQAAARLHRRRSLRRTVAILGQWHPRYLHVADRIEKLLEKRVCTFRWTGDLITREDLVNALGSGLGLGIYVGHGRAVGWVGYRGMRASHFDQFQGEPLGSVMSLCCRTASRRRTGLSYAEALPLSGVAGASFAAVRETRHTDNTRWAVRVCELIASGVDTIGELVVKSAPLNPSAAAPYRIIGDPLAPLSTDPAGERRARAVRTYP
jgi:hypothetical protein